MDYLLFSYPNCAVCEELRESLSSAELSATEYDLVQKESKMKIRDYLSVIKRDEKGAIIIPSLILEEAGKVKAVLNSGKELEEWLKSEA
jgi:hypothetical protein